MRGGAPRVSVIPAKAGIQLPCGYQSWTPAFAGVTDLNDILTQ